MKDGEGGDNHVGEHQDPLDDLSPAFDDSVKLAFLPA